MYVEGNNEAKRDAWRRKTPFLTSILQIIDRIRPCPIITQGSLFVKAESTDLEILRYHRAI